MDAALQQASNTKPPVESALLHAAFAGNPEALLLIDEGKVALANPAAARLLGYRNAHLLAGEPVTNFLAHGRFCQELNRSADTSECAHPACESVLRRAGGDELRVALRCTRVDHDAHSLVLIAFHEARRTEIGELLWAGEPRFRTIFEAAAMGISSCTLDGRLIEANPAFSRMMGYRPSELVGMAFREFHPDDFQDEQPLWEEMACGSRDSFEIEKHFRKKDGALLSAHAIVSLVRDSNALPAFAIAMLEDVTARKRAEDRLREAEKMEVIGRLAGGIAHDFNNLLTGILLYCDLALSSLPPDDPSHHHVEEIRLAGEHGAALTQQLLSIARKQAPQPRAVQLNEVVSSTENLLRRLIGEQIELITALGADVEPVLADPGQIRQVILNLALNARDAMPDGGQITVSTHSTVMPGRATPAVSLQVADNGCGMDSETRARLFEPFFTTKKAGHGTGLGLSTVQRIVQEAGGVITVASERGHGTRFEIVLPACGNSLTASPEPAPAEAQTILLVDDHASARRSMQRILCEAGFRVLPASSGKQAIKVFDEQNGGIDLLLADWMMPGMTGQELAQALHRKSPAMKTLLISGYQAPHDVPPNLSVDLIQKPFARNALIERVRAVLDRKGEAP